MKYCDLVMKGGITSGLVYPNAVLALSRDYRFKNIGGTSAGAIAAAVSAAAAYGDRQKLGGAAGPELGFAGLETTAVTLRTKGFIFGLFQPVYGVRQAFRLLVALTGHGSTLQKFGAFLLAIPLMAPAEILFILALLLVLGFWLGGGWGGVAAAMIPALLCAFAVGVVGAGMRVARVARRNLLGLCNGMPSKGSAHPALTAWLYERVQTLAGKPLTEPLTFGQLWAAARYEDEPPTEKSIQLQVITTDVSHHEPLSLPSEREFWFRDDQFDKLFPAPLMAVLKQLPAEPVGRHTYRRLPKGADLPVIIAARMSLSFPVLISAIPLHERVYGRTAPAAAPQEGTVSEQPFGAPDDAYDDTPTASTTEVTFRELWFSDGGISSNFPVHLFDSALPRWPTFAVNLVDEKNAGRSLEDSVWIPPGNNEGWRQKHYPIAAPMAAKELLNFLFGIIATMQNWRDLQQARAPGYRDRIAHVALSKDEGGLNLDMPADVLKKISDKGAIAGARFSGFSFNNHYWIRWRNVASTLQGFTRQLAQNSRSPIPDYAAAHDLAQNLAEPPSYQFSSNDRRDGAARLLTSLEQQGKEWTDLGPDLTTGAPSPRPVLRITPTF